MHGDVNRPGFGSPPTIGWRIIRSRDEWLRVVQGRLLRRHLFIETSGGVRPREMQNAVESTIVMVGAPAPTVVNAIAGMAVANPWGGDPRVRLPSGSAPLCTIGDLAVNAPEKVPLVVRDRIAAQNQLDRPEITVV